MIDSKQKRIPKFDGRPMLWLSEDGGGPSLEIRYGVGPKHKHECGDDRGEWYTFEGEFYPKDCVELGDIFLGYL